MEKIIINGGAKLNGSVQIGGSKNSVVALIPASILCKDKVRFYNYPKISDVDVLIDILYDLNVDVCINEEYIEIDSSHIKNTSLTSEKMSKIRASYYFMGALISLFDHAEITLPGGDFLGPRPIDLHIKGFENLNCKYEIEKDIFYFNSKELYGNKIILDKVSVGATINIMLASVFARGETTIENAAKEPEIVDVANFLNKMGAKIEGAGTSIIKITGVKDLHGTEHRVIPDRIETGTYLLMGAACARNLELRNVNPNHMHVLISKLVDSNVKISIEKDTIIVQKADKLLPINLKTEVYPGFATDLQQITTALMTQACGRSFIYETIYPSRFKNCDELIKMGARIIVENASAIVFGPTRLIGTTVKAEEIRGGASLILASLVAEGETIIEGAEHIFRGYGDIVNNLKNVNVDINVMNS